MSKGRGELSDRKEEIPVDLTKSRYHALLIAVERYMDENITNLQHPIGDAERLQEVLTGKYTFEEDHVVLLRDPDRSRIIGALEDGANRTAPGDHLLIFYAGHGHWDGKRKQGYWLPQNAHHQRRADWISNSDVRDLIAGVNARHTLLISDACFSGGIFRARKGVTSPRRALNKLYRLPSRRAMTSGTSGEEVPDESVFVHYLMDRLYNSEKRWLTSHELFATLEEPVLSNGPNVPQYGTIQGTGHEGGDFVFLRREEIGATEKEKAPSIVVPSAEPLTGSLVLIASHAGMLKIDGRKRGQVEAGAVRTVENLKPGGHFIEIEAEGCKPWNETVHITAGHSEVLKASLEAKKVRAEVKVPVKGKRETRAVTRHSPAYTNSLHWDGVRADQAGEVFNGIRKGS